VRDGRRSRDGAGAYCYLKFKYGYSCLLLFSCSLLAQLIDSLDDPDGDPHRVHSVFRAAMGMAMDKDSKSDNSGGVGFAGLERPKSSLLSGAASFAGGAKANDGAGAGAGAGAGVGVGVGNGNGNGRRGSGGGGGAVGTAAVNRQMEVLKLRELRLTSAEDVVAQFLEASDGYHKVAKRLIDQKRENLMLWGNDVSDI
jgi:hypothetical protein